MTASFMFVQPPSSGSTWGALRLTFMVPFAAGAAAVPVSAIWPPVPADATDARLSIARSTASAANSDTLR